METKIFNLVEFKKLIFSERTGNIKKEYKNLQDEIKYFHWDDFSTLFSSKEYLDSLHFIVAFEGKFIIGIAKIAIFETSNHQISLSYLSIRNDFKNKGISKEMVRTMLEFTKNHFPNIPFGTSQFTYSGYLYLRKSLLEESKRIGIIFNDNVCGYVDRGLNNEEYYKLIKESREEYKRLYNKEMY